MQNKNTNRIKYTTRETLTAKRLWARDYGGPAATWDQVMAAAVAVSQLMRIERKLRRHYEDAANGWPTPIRETRFDAQGRPRVFTYTIEDTARRARAELATAKLEAKARGLATEFGFEIRINTDPRGAAIKLNLIPQPNPSAADSIDYVGMDTDLLCDDAPQIARRNKAFTLKS